MAKNKKWYHHEVPLEKWMHKHLQFKNDGEFALFLVFMLFVGVFFYSLS